MREIIQARRDSLAAQIEEATDQFNQLESMAKELDRQLCAMIGGLQELDNLLATEQEEEVSDADIPGV